MEAKIITMFNHKGGVSKTTTTYNLGWKLTDLGKKVLLVDADPQCNLTSLLLGESFEQYYTDETTKNLNLKDSVKVAFEGKPKPITAIDCYIPETNNKLHIIPGHMDLSEYDPSLSLALNSNNAISTLQNLPGSFYELIRLCSEKYEIDYVLIDMNPGLSAINQTLFMSSDGFIIPTNPDPFSIMALRTLKNILPRWKKWAVQSRELFKEASYPLPDAEMKFIGEVIQRFNIRKQKAARPYQGKIDEIREYTEKDLVPELLKHSMVYDLSELISQGRINDYCLAEISEFGSLIQKANTHYVPVFALTNEQIGESGQVLDQMAINRDRFDQIFKNLANYIIEIVK
ncbi:AAA family ATPase [Paenibacillus sp. FSL R5-0341]|uniref:ParA family protein n=1 Tax=Paenibacillus sp. FSL R5-0341 TaxID=2921636 RepID=UPI0030CCA38C